MSRTDQSIGVEGTPARPVATADQAADLLDLLGDEKTRQILQAAGTPKTAAEIAEEVDLPLSTTYRKIDGATDRGLLEETNGDVPENKPRRYRRTTADLIVNLERVLQVTFRPSN